MKVYLVSDDDGYTPSKVTAVFSSEDKAARYAELNACYVECVDFDPEFIDVHQGNVYWHVLKSISTNSFVANQRSGLDRNGNAKDESLYRQCRDVLSCYVWAKNKEEAIELAKQRMINGD